MDNLKGIKFNFRKMLLKVTAVVVIAAFLLTGVFRDLAWAFPSESDFSLRATAAGKEWVAGELEKELQEDAETRLSRQAKSKNKNSLEERKRRVREEKSTVFQASITQLKKKGKYEDKVKGFKKVLRNRAAAEKSLTSKTIIFYTETVLKNGGVDLPDALKILLEKQVLDKVILYSEKPVYNKILEGLIGNIKPGLKIIEKTKGNLGLASGAGEIEEIKELIESAKAEGIEAKDILCVIKGTVEDKERAALKKLSEKPEIPAILLFEGSHQGQVFSMAEAIQYVIDDLNKDLPPLRTEGISKEIEDYKNSLQLFVES